MNNNQKTYVFDLDNTLCRTEESNYFDSVPYMDRIEKVNQLHDAGHIIIVETARGCVSGKKWFVQTMEQLRRWGLQFDTLRAGVKFSADYYIDDKGINSEDFFNDTRSLNSESGSGVQTNVVVVNRVLKEATEERVDKLADEIRFIENMPRQFKGRFPEIIFSKIDNDKAFYEMKHHNLPTIRRLILSGEMDAEEVVSWSDKITEFSMSMYRHEKVDIDTDAFFTALHWNRFSTRLVELEKKSEWFKDILQQQTVTINGEEYTNITFLIDKIKAKQDWFKPEFIGRWSHSDLHFSNILIDRTENDFVLIDPRGYDFCEYYYDYGKLWHSVNGKYELITTNMFDISKPSEPHTFSLYEGPAWHVLEDSKSGIMDSLCKHSSEPRDTVILKTEFNDVMHFATLLPFMLDFNHTEERARGAYYQSVMLMNNFCKKHGVI